MRKLLFNYYFYSHPEIGNFRVWHQTPRSSNFHSFAGGAWCLFDFLSWCVGSPL
jgi:hypothetical protein